MQPNFRPTPTAGLQNAERLRRSIEQDAKIWREANLAQVQEVILVFWLIFVIPSGRAAASKPYFATPAARTASSTIALRDSYTSIRRRKGLAPRIAARSSKVPCALMATAGTTPAPRAGRAVVYCC